MTSLTTSKLTSYTTSRIRNLTFVMDIDVLVEGCRPGGGPSHDLLIEISKGNLKPHSSPELHADYGVALQGAVLQREVRLRKEEAELLLASMSHYVREVDIDQVHVAEVIAKAPELVHVIATAKSAGVDMIVSNRPDKVQAVLKSRAIKVVRPKDLI